MINLKKIIILFLLVVAIASAGYAQQATRVVVRARAQNAKFIGDEVGGTMITMLDASSGDTLASGLTKGGTGNTRRLLKKPVGRYDKLSGPGDAKFVARLSLQRPTLVTIRATANANNEGTNITSSTQQWIIPGQDITGDGIILEIPGFLVTNHLPKPNKTYRAGSKVPIRTHIVMMCGCATKPGGLWDSSDYDIQALIIREGNVVKKVPLTFAGQTSLFEGSFTPDKTGHYIITVAVFNSRTGNSGVAKTQIKVQNKNPTPN